MITHLVGGLLFLAVGGIAVYRARWWSRQNFDIHVMYGSHSHQAEKSSCDPRKSSWCIFLFAVGLASIAFGLWQLVAMALSS